MDWKEYKKENGVKLIYKKFPEFHLKKGDISNPTLKVDGRENFLSIKIFTF